MEPVSPKRKWHFAYVKARGNLFYLDELKCQSSISVLLRRLVRFMAADPTWRERKMKNPF